MENVRKITPWKMEENSSLENNRVENAHPGKWQKNHTLEKARKIMTGKCQNGKCTSWKMKEQKVHTMEFVRKCTLWKMVENTPLEIKKLENGHKRK